VPLTVDSAPQALARGEAPLQRSVGVESRRQTEGRITGVHKPVVDLVDAAGIAPDGDATERTSVLQ
jgi:hypothetical protein